MTRILLVDDHFFFRKTLRGIIDSQTDMTVVAEAGDGKTALTQARLHAPDIVLMDIDMPEMDGIEATRRITKELPHTRVVVLSSYSEDFLIKKLKTAGASGALSKLCSKNDLLSVLRNAACQSQHHPFQPK